MARAITDTPAREEVSEILWELLDNSETSYSEDFDIRPAEQDGWMDDGTSIVLEDLARGDRYLLNVKRIIE